MDLLLPPQRVRRVIAVLAIGVLLGGCRRAAPDSATEVRPVGVTVRPARTDTLRDIATASGMVVPAPAADLTIFAAEPAQIITLPKKEGDAVAIGDLLVGFEIPSVTQDLTARQLVVAEAQIRVDRARAEAKRLTELFERGITSRNAFEAAKVEQSTSESMLGQAVTALEAAKIDAVRTSVRARFPGTVMKVWHAEGDFVTGSPNDPILQVVDPSRLQVSLQLPVIQLARIVPGQSATVLAIGGDGPAPAVVVQKVPITDPNAPTGEVRLTLEGVPLALNTPASVEILLDQRADAVVVPVEALLKDDMSAFVVVAGDDHRAHRRDVRTGLITRDQAQIISGLAAGERVIVGGLRDVSEGTLISFTE